MPCPRELAFITLQVHREVPHAGKDLLQDWQRAEAACIAAYQAMYDKAKRGALVSAEEMERLAKLSRDARERYHRYLEQVSGDDLPRPE